MYILINEPIRHPTMKTHLGVCQDVELFGARLFQHIVEAGGNVNEAQLVHANLEILCLPV